MSAIQSLHIYRRSQLRRPMFLVMSVAELTWPRNLECLRIAGIHCLAFDLENTLVRMHGTLLDPETLEILKVLEQHSFKLIIFTNTSRDMTALRQQLVDSGLNVPVLQANGSTVLKKPDRTAFAAIRGMADEHFGYSGRIAYVGDKFDHDVSAAIRADLEGILVNPLGADLKAEQLILMRWRETRALRRLGLQRPYRLA